VNIGHVFPWQETQRDIWQSQQVSQRTPFALPACISHSTTPGRHHKGWEEEIPFLEVAGWSLLAVGVVCKRPRGLQD